MTRKDVEAVLAENGFHATKGANHVWIDDSGSRFVRFPEDGDDGFAIYGDSEREEAGIQLSYNKAISVLAGVLTPRAAERAGFRMSDGVLARQMPHGRPRGSARIGASDETPKALPAHKAKKHPAVAKVQAKKKAAKSKAKKKK
jgi:hypothetical protein